MELALETLHLLLLFIIKKLQVNKGTKEFICNFAFEEVGGMGMNESDKHLLCVCHFDF